jgi:NTE family protein
MAPRPADGDHPVVSVLTSLRVRRGPRASEHRYRDAVVLSGGGSLGAVQVGVLRALYEAGVRPDLFVGCSVGALNGAFLAVDPGLERLAELERLWRALDRESVFGRGRRILAAQLLSVAVRKEDHLYEPDALQDLVRRWVRVDDLADTAVPVHVVTTDLLSGQPVWWSSGDPVQVLTASACLPALFPPVALGGTLHVDGGVTCPVPVERALALGAERTWVVDVSGGSIGRRDERMSALDVLLLSFAISRARLDRGEEEGTGGQRVVRLPRVDVGVHELRDFSRTPAFMQAGYAVAKEAVRAELSRVPAPRRRPAGA